MEALEPLKVQFGEWKMQLKPYCEEFLFYLRPVTPVRLYVAIAVLVFCFPSAEPLGTQGAAMITMGLTGELYHLEQFIRTQVKP